jgi:hypothetical protein
LGLAATSVHLHFTDAVGVTLRLDRTPLTAAARIEGEAEVQLWTDAVLRGACGLPLR